jgi:hypothetical protein
MCLQDISTGTVHPCVCRISPMAQSIPVFAGYDHWHISSLCFQDVTIGTIHWARLYQSTSWCTCFLCKSCALPRTVVSVVSVRALLDVTVPAPTHLHSDRISDKVYDLYSRRSGFESRSGHELWWRFLWFLRWHRPAVYILSLKCHINRQTQPYSFNLLVLYSALLHVSFVYMSQHQVGIGSGFVSSSGRQIPRQ